MKIPPQIDILGQTYKIQVKEDATIEGKPVDGYCDFANYLIVIRKSRNKQYMHRTYLHEIAHAYAYESGLYEILTAETQEMFAQTLSGFLKSFIR